MKTIGIRALKQNASEVVSEVSAGVPVTITDRGRPVAQLVPIREGVLDRLITSGRARPPRRTFASLLGRSPRSGELSKVLAKMREEERY